MAGDNPGRSAHQPIRLDVDEPAVFDEVLLQVAFLLEAGFHEHAGRSLVERKDVGRDLAEAEFVEWAFSRSA